jgi:hypothetical protein
MLYGKVALLEHGASKTINNNNNKALTLSSFNGHTEIVRLLLEHGADPNMENTNGDTPLLISSNNGHTEISKLLLEHGADPNIENTNTPLNLAAVKGHTEIAKLLLEHGAEPNILINNTTALISATHKEYTEIVKLLLEHGADPNIGNTNGLTAFVSTKNQEIISLLRRYGEKNKMSIDRVKKEECAETLLGQVTCLIKDIKSNSNEVSEDNLKMLALYYSKNPKLITDIERSDPRTYERIKGYKDYLLDFYGCNNLQYNEVNNIVFHYDGKKLWCYNLIEWEEVVKKGVYNPYTLNNFEREFNEDHPSKIMLHLSNRAYKNIKFWAEYTYTLGKVFFKVPSEIAIEYAKTLSKNYTYFLLRGMAFKNIDEYSKFFHKIKYGEFGDDIDAKGTVNFETFTSWTYEKVVARKFASKFLNQGGYGVMLMKEFKANELLVDLTRITNPLLYYEEEVIALPFVGDVYLVDVIELPPMT